MTGTPILTVTDPELLRDALTDIEQLTSDTITAVRTMAALVTHASQAARTDGAALAALGHLATATEALAAHYDTDVHAGIAEALGHVGRTLSGPLPTTGGAR
jgi:hypothetical protein